MVSNQAYIEQYDSGSMDNVINFLIRYLSDNPAPRYIQLDNGMSFIGNFKNPRRFSCFVRLGLYVGIEVVFIAPEHAPSDERKHRKLQWLVWIKILG